MTNADEAAHEGARGEQTVEDRVASLFEALLSERVPTGGAAASHPSDDFFERGGNSMLAARLVARLRREFDVDVSVRDVFRGRTVTAVSETVRNRVGARR
jgi:hypothetical protein